MGGLAIGAARSSRPRAVAERAGSLRPVLGVDTKSAAARADPRGTLFVGARRIVRRRPRRSGNCRLALLGQPLLVSRPVPAATLSRDAVRRARACSRRTDRRARRRTRAAARCRRHTVRRPGRRLHPRRPAARPGRGDPRRSAWQSMAAAGRGERPGLAAAQRRGRDHALLAGRDPGRLPRPLPRQLRGDADAARGSRGRRAPAD